MSNGDEYEYNYNKPSVPRIDKEKIKEFFRNLKDSITAGKKMLVIMVAIIAIATIGSLTSYASMVLKQREREIANIQSRLNFCKANLEECNAEKQSLNQQISNLNMELQSVNRKVESCEVEKQNLQSLFQTCSEEKSSLEENLASCMSNLTAWESKYESISSDYYAIAKNFAITKCCPDYEYYVITDNNVLCCLRSGDEYLCGKGLSFPSNKILTLEC